MAAPEPKPPRWAAWLLRTLVPGRDGEVIAGDLEEDYAARGGGAARYCGQALSCILVRLNPARRLLPGTRDDLHFALRIIRRNPGYAVTAMLCLGLGIGVNTAIFSLMDELFLRPLPVPEPSRVVRIERGAESYFPWQDTVEFRRRSRSFTSLAAYSAGITGLEVDGVLELVAAEWVSANYGETLRLPLALGRWFQPGEEARGAERVAVISHRVWTRRFAGAPGVIGKLVRVETEYYRVIGVAPAGYRGVFPPHEAAIWIPFLAFPSFQKRLDSGGVVRAALLGRLAEGVTQEQARLEMNQLDARIRRELPRPPSRPGRNDSGPLAVNTASGAASEAQRQMRPLAFLLLAVVVCVLLIACVNVANLLLARAAVRRHEMAVRQAMGASRLRLLRQALVEGMVLAAGGGLLGLLFGVWATRTLGLLIPNIPTAFQVSVELDVNGRVAALTACVALIAAVLFSLAPARENWRSAVVVRPSVRKPLLRDAYVVAQVAISLVLLITAGLFVRALQRAEDLDPGFATANRLVTRIYLSAPEFTPVSGRVFYERVLDELSTTPGVAGAALSYAPPLGFTDRDCASLEREPEPPTLSSTTILGRYFDVMGIPLVRGRSFDNRDQAGGTPVIVVNETFARRHWPGADPIGRTVWLGCGKDDRQQAQVIGVTRDSKYSSLNEPPQPFLYRSLSQRWTSGLQVLIVHTRGEPSSFGPTLRSLLLRLDPKVRYYDMSALDEQVKQSLWQVRWEASMLAAFGLLAIVLAAVGLYGVIAYSVAQRTREFGVRMALGARREDVLWMVLGRGLRVTAAGIVLGVAISVGVTRFLRGFLDGVSPLDAAAFAAAVLAWLVLSMLASFVPARRATRIEPVVALRYE